MDNPRPMAGQEFLDAVWDDVPEGAEPEHFASRRDFLLSHVEAGQAVLDLGSGEGAFSAALAQAGARPIAVDVADEPLRRLRARFPQLSDVRRATAGEELPVAGREVDVVWAGEVLEHVVDVGATATEMRRVLKPGGVALVTTPDHPWRVRARWVLSARAFERDLHPYADHVRFFTARTLRMVLDDAGFDRIDVRRVKGHLHAVAR
jgi:2-polyprenyl-3-methyl-5-hydroxy-6-metoxy-1,4-benzoquinol methylase